MRHLVEDNAGEGKESDEPAKVRAVVYSHSMVDGGLLVMS